LKAKYPYYLSFLFKEFISRPKRCTIGRTDAFKNYQQPNGQLSKEEAGRFDFMVVQKNVRLRYPAAAVTDIRATVQNRGTD
jgi:hypothetical protein